MSERITFDGNFCDITRCAFAPGGPFCVDRSCSQRKVWERLKAYEDKGLSPEETLTGKELAEIACAMNLLKEYQGFGTIEHFRELVQAEQDGRLVVLPCKVGDTVYVIDGERISMAEVTIIRPFVFGNRIEFRGNAVLEEVDLFYSDGRLSKRNLFITFGDDAFLTREEAEAALRKGKKQPYEQLCSTP